MITGRIMTVLDQLVSARITAIPGQVTWFLSAIITVYVIWMRN